MYKAKEPINRGQPRADREKIESPLEELFIENFEKYVLPSAEIIPQYIVQTSIGQFRLDFVIDLDGRKIGFECDGKQFHDTFRDEWRDGFILENGDVETIYRFRGKDLYVMVDDCIYYIYKCDPAIFNDRYQHIFPRLVSPETLEYFEDFGESLHEMENSLIPFGIRNEFSEKVGEPSYLCTRRQVNHQGHWKVLLDFANLHPHKTLDQLISKYNEAHNNKEKL